MAGQVVRRLLWWLLVGSIAVAVLRGTTLNPDGLLEWAAGKADELKAFVEHLVAKFPTDGLPKLHNVLPSATSTPSAK